MLIIIIPAIRSEKIPAGGVDKLYQLYYYF